MKPSNSDLKHLDAALGRLRRLWDSPAIKERLLEQLGMPVELSLLRTLRAIEWAGDEPGVRHVAAALRVEESTASRFVDQAVAGGCVTRTTSPRDRRRCVLALTDKGTWLLAEATAVRTKFLADVTADWSPAELATLRTLLERFVDSVFEKGHGG